MSIVFFGTPAFAVPSLRALIEAGERIEAVVTRPDKVKDRTRRPTPSEVKEYAVESGLRVLQPSSMKDESFMAELKNIFPEFIVVVAFGRILTRAILDIPRRAAVNVHASLLPNYRGASPIAWAIINGEKETGITTMLISERLDEGDILLQETMNIEDYDTTETLYKRLSESGAALLVKTIKGLREGTIEPKPQSGEPSFAPPFKKEDGRVDWSKPARDICNFQRGMHPWPGAFTYVDNERVKLVRVKVVNGATGPFSPGQITDITEDAIVVGTGGGLIAILELQPEGKRPMSAGAYRRGRMLKAGMRVS